MAHVLQLGMTTITIKNPDRALDAGAWLERQHIQYELESIGLFGPNPRYQFRFHNPKDASHFALRWR
jgi:hypothetical protein